MKNWLLIFLVSWGVGGNETSKINSLKKEAEAAFKAGNYQKASEKFSFLIDSMQVKDENAFLNLGHSYFQMGESEKAQTQYQKLVLSEKDELKSIAYQQLGALSNDPKTLEKALTYFKSSLKADPYNEDSRYNYELIKKKLDQQNDQNQDDQNQDQDNQEDQENKEDQESEEQQDQENQDQNQEQQDQESEGDQNQEQEQEGQEGEDQEQNQEGQQSEEENKEEGEESQEQEGQEGENQEEQEQQKQGEEGDQEGEEEQSESQSEGEEGEEGEDQEKSPKPSTSDKLKEMNIPEEKARMILEALKNNEIQYIQQNQRKATQKRDSGKPDW